MFANDMWETNVLLAFIGAPIYGVVASVPEAVLSIGVSDGRHGPLESIAIHIVQYFTLAISLACLRWIGVELTRRRQRLPSGN
jgi:hypothetical protein